LRSETEQGRDNEGEKSGTPDEESHGLTLDDSESISHWTRGGSRLTNLSRRRPLLSRLGLRQDGS
jgi:hypothetical protein